MVKAKFVLMTLGIGRGSKGRENEATILHFEYEGLLERTISGDELYRGETCVGMRQQDRRRDDGIHQSMAK